MHFVQHIQLHTKNLLAHEITYSMDISWVHLRQLSLRQMRSRSCYPADFSYVGRLVSGLGQLTAAENPA